MLEPVGVFTLDAEAPFRRDVAPKPRGEDVLDELLAGCGIESPDGGLSLDMLPLA